MRRTLGFALIILGLFCISASILQSNLIGNANIGGAIFIGPIPIVFGSSPQMVMASIIMAIVFIILTVIIVRRRE
jgi:uncharacterized protein (TIGR00304 family)